MPGMSQLVVNVREALLLDKKTITRILLVAVIYFLLASLSEYLFEPTFTFFTIRLAPGLGLAVALVYGLPAISGIFLGEFLYFYFLHHSEITMPVSITLGANAALYGYIGTRLIRQFMELPNSLSNSLDWLKFFMLGGFAASCIPALLSVYCISLIEPAVQQSFWLLVSHWWIGQVFGILIISPVALCFIWKSIPVWQARISLVPVLSTILLAVVVAVYTYVSFQEKQQLESLVEQKSMSMSSAIKLDISNYGEALHSIKSVFEYSPDISPEEFEMFSSKIKIRQPGIHASSYQPLVKADERPSFEHRMREFYSDKFQITERDDSGNFIRAGEREEYTPIAMRGIYDKNAKIIGYDTSSSPFSKEARWQAKITNEVAISRAFRLASTRGNSKSIVLYLPLNSNGYFSGYVASSIYAVKVIQSAIERINLTGFSLKIWDGPSSENNIIYSKNTIHTDSRLVSGNTGKINFSTRNWTYELVPDAVFLEPLLTAQWLVILFCILTISIVNVRLFDITGKKQDLKQRVSLSEDKYRGIFDESVAAICVFDRKKNFIDTNQAGLDLLGYSRVELLGMQAADIDANLDFKAMMLAIKQLLLGRKIINLEHRLVRKDGTIITVLSNSKPLKDDRGRTAGLQTTFIDITERKKAEETLSMSERMLKEAQSIANLGHWSRDILQDKIIWSDQVFKMYGYEPQAFQPTLKHFLQIVHQDDRKLVLKSFRDAVQKPTSTDFRIIRPDGVMRYISGTAENVLNPSKQVTDLFGVVQDITERRQVDEEVLKLSRAVEASSSVVFITDLDGTIEYVNPKFTDATGYTKDEIIGQNPRILKSGETPENIYEDMWETITSGGEWIGEMHNRKKDGSYYWGRSSVSGVKNEKNEITHYIAIQDDVTHEYEMAEKLTYQASHDALTGLINRHEFERRAERLLTTIKTDRDDHALCFMDLDQFKVVNDTCGHAAGDEMLRQLGQVLQDAVRHRDTLARIGGDEFGVLMEHCSLDHAHRVASSLQRTVQDFQFVWEGRSFKVGVSIGLIAITESIPNLTELLKGADVACYQAKDLGRNRIHVYQTEDESLARRQGEMQWVARINQAIEEDRFCLYAQTIVPLDNRTDKHYELLIRMKDDKDGVILPGAFLPAAERYDLITKLDYWTVENTFGALSKNPGFLKQINFISVNLSGQSLADEPFLDFVVKLIHDTGVEGEKVCFEITETTAISNLSTATEFISKLKELGCRFALDDFGSGLSSFGYLKRLPVDYLKIDGMFVKDIVDDPIDHAMVKSINEIGHVMGMQTIAEFVENDVIKGMLKEIGVDYGQGFGIDKPIPLDELLGRSNNVTNINKLKNA